MTTVGLTRVVYASEEAADIPAEGKSSEPAGLPSSTESPQPAGSTSSQREAAAVRPVIGISQRVHTGPKKKKDLGTLGEAPPSAFLHHFHTRFASLTRPVCVCVCKAMSSESS